MRNLAIAVIALLFFCSPLAAQPTDPSSQPVPGMADSPTITVLKGLTVPQFESEMQLFVQALGVNCGYCHARGKFSSDEKPQKLTARKMIEMVQSINKEYFPDYKPGAEESTLGRVTCYTCHQGSTTPKSTVGDLADARWHH